jgi:hypothetical protein
MSDALDFDLDSDWRRFTAALALNISSAASPTRRHQSQLFALTDNQFRVSLLFPPLLHGPPHAHEPSACDLLTRGGAFSPAVEPPKENTE